MKSIVIPIAMVIIALTLTSCGSGTDPAELRKMLEDEYAPRFVNAFNADDAARLAEFYSEDAVLLPPNDLMVSGRGNIQQFWSQLMPNANDLRITVMKVDASGELAYEIGTYSLSIQMPNAAPYTDEGKYAVCWKKQSDDSWKIVMDIFNTSLPLASSAQTQ